MPLDIGRFVARIDANRTMKDELTDRMKESRPRQRISVTDLLNPRKAFMQRVHPDIQPTLERKEVMFAGRGFHEVFGHAVSSEEYLEQFIEWEDVVGVIDVYKDIPTELKTTSGIEEGEDLRLSRPYYVEQIAMYCAMVDKAEGRILLYDRGSDEKRPSLTVYDVAFGDIEGIRVQMRTRRDALVAALKEGVPRDLPACPWIGRGCEYEAVCQCEDAKEFEPTIARLTPPLKVNAEEAKKILSTLSSARPVRRRGINTLVFPRRAYFDSVQKAEEETPEERLETIEKVGRKRALTDVLRFGHSADSVRRPVSFGDIEDKVTLHQGVPTLLRSVRLNSVVSRENLVRMFEHYFTRLAFDCALAGSSKGRMIIHYEKLDEDSKLMVYDVQFSDIEALKGEAENRLMTFREVKDGQADPRKLPPCPSWMRSYCPYQPSCGC